MQQRRELVVASAQRLRLFLLQPPKLLMAGGWIAAAARPRAAAPFVRAEPERAQHVALRAPCQFVALVARQRLPLLARQPAGIVAFGHNVRPLSCAMPKICEWRMASSEWREPTIRYSPLAIRQRSSFPRRTCARVLPTKATNLLPPKK